VPVDRAVKRRTLQRFPVAAHHLATRSNQRRVGQSRYVSSANSDKNLQVA
jgi:hypothetical protein